MDEAPKRKRNSALIAAGREMAEAHSRRIAITKARGHRTKGKKRRAATTAENRDRLSRAISSYGIQDIEAIIKAGPFQLTLVDTEKGEKVLPLYEERSRLWQYALTFAADRGGLPKQQSIQVEGEVALSPIEVKFTNFKRPADT
jgi:hypothetical protein